MHSKSKRKTKLTLKNYVQSFGCDFVFSTFLSSKIACCRCASALRLPLNQKENRKRRKKNILDQRRSKQKSKQMKSEAVESIDGPRSARCDKNEMQDEIRCQIVFRVRLLFQRESSAFGEKQNMREDGMKWATAWRATDNSCLSETKMNHGRSDAVTDCRLSYGIKLQPYGPLLLLLPNKSGASALRLCEWSAWPVFSCLLFANANVYSSWASAERYHRNWYAAILIQYLTQALRAGTSALFFATIRSSLNIFAQFHPKHM